MKMVYIASPFRGDYDTNLKNAIEYCKIASNLGVLPVAPHIMFSGWCRDHIPEERERGLRLGIELLAKAEELWIMGKVHSEGMKGEILFAREQNIPIYYIPEPTNPVYYPVSTDDIPLLCDRDCTQTEKDVDISGKMVILPHSCLSAEYRSAINQIWIATHGPGCHGSSFSDTVHLRHPVDQDIMAVGRHELCGVAGDETIKQMMQVYPALETSLYQQNNQAEEVYER